MANTVIRIKYKRGVGIANPNGAIIYPKLHPKTKSNGPFPMIPYQDYDFENDTYDIPLEDEVFELPEYIESEVDESVRKQMIADHAKVISEAHRRNNRYRKALKEYEKQGMIEIISDSFLDTQKKKK